eukprot:1155657-Amphidinium_carterae.1
MANPAEYSPVVTPEAQQVDSSTDSSSAPSTPQMPKWSELSHEEALNILFIHQDSVIELAPDTLNHYWKSDSMHDTYESLAPTWLKVFKDHALINGMNADLDDVPDGYSLKFIHT